MTTNVVRPFATVAGNSWPIRTVLFLILLTVAASAQVQVTGQHSDSFRRGQNTHETILTPSSVASGQFGKLFSYVIDGPVSAQPLYVPNVTIPGKGIHNVLYVATLQDSIYAFDADDANENASPLWMTSFLNPARGITAVSQENAGCSGAMGPEAGIGGTPVIDTATNTMYLVSATQENGSVVQRLHALDIRTGAEKFGGPTTIVATYPGAGAGSLGGELAFDSARQVNRSALWLSDKNVFINWSSNCGSASSPGWQMAYDKTRLQQNGVWLTSPSDGSDSRIPPSLTSQAGGFGAPAYWNNDAYFAGAGDTLKAFRLNNGRLSSSPVSSSSTTLGSRGAAPSVSANGTSDGIVWVIGDDPSADSKEILYAYDALNLGYELYNSALNGVRDNPGLADPLVAPTIANGKVYVAATGQVSVYGLFGVATNETQTATPTFSPAGGTYTSTQSVTISDTTDGATIYYTTDGSTPTTSSPVYTAPITISQDTTLKAMAAAPGDLNSNVATALYTITTGGGGSLNYGSGFTANGLAFNGKASLDGTNLLLTDGGTSEISSAWYTTKVNVQAFTQDFSILLTNARGDGMTFVIQNAGTTALGPPGAGLGYGAKHPGGALGIPNSIAIKFDLYNNLGEGSNSTGLYTNGASPTVPALNMNGSGVSLHSGDVLNIHMTYNGVKLFMTITDSVTNAVFSATWQIDIPGTIGATTAYVGFTAASGGATATQEVLNWTFAAPYAVGYQNGFDGIGLSLNGNAKLNGTRLRLTDGAPSEKSSAYYSAPVNINAFTCDFVFQPTQAHGDGLTFVIQNAGLTALGPAGAGLGYGATQPNGRPGIATSVAVKFDLYNNDGEGRDSTGLYTDGASPTIPAIDLSGSGINLHNGDPFSVFLTYDGTTLTMRITDVITKATFLYSWTIDIPTTVGGNTAYVGFTGASGGGTAIQDILGWTFGGP